MGGLVGTGRLPGHAETQPAATDLDIEVSFGPTRELVEDVVLADHGCDRSVDVVVPAGGGFRQRYLPPALEAEEIAVPEDVLKDLVVAPQPADLDPCLLYTSPSPRD